MADSLDLMRARRVAMSEAAICERNKAIEQILRWCDRSGEEPEGQCLHEIEQICRKQLGLELVRHDPCANPQCFICNRELRDQAAYDQSMSDLAASGGIVDAP